MSEQNVGRFNISLLLITRDSTVDIISGAANPYGETLIETIKNT